MLWLLKEMKEMVWVVEGERKAENDQKECQDSVNEWEKLWKNNAENYRNNASEITQTPEITPQILGITEKKRC